MTKPLIGLVLGLLSLGAVACDDECTTTREQQSKECQERGETPAPTPLPPPPIAVNVFEFRVLGDVDGVVDIRYGTTQEGTTILRSQTPWFVTVRTTQASAFLTLTARVPVDPDVLTPAPVFLQVQIVVNGIVFREASGLGLEPSVAVSGLFQAP